MGTLARLIVTLVLEVLLSLFTGATSARLIVTPMLSLSTSVNISQTYSHFSA